jgi:N-acyl-D-aspartate/D-glutamate deacylase
MYDLIISGARVADGSGAPLRTADLAVADGRIVAIGKLAEPARERVDADGLVLAPGIVDVHTHYDAQLTWDRTASPSPSLGVTTVVIGNCGFTIAPCPAAQRDLVARNLSEVEGMPLEALREGIDWSFETFREYLDLLEKKGGYPNVAAFIGHSTVRTAVMGEHASRRAAMADEVAAMRRLVDEGMAAGAVGLSSSASENHSGFGGVPMPSRLAAESEFRALAGALGAAGRGIYQMTAGPTTTVAFLESLARDTGRPVIFTSVFQNDAFPERGPGQLADCAAAQARGAEVYGQTSCQPLTMDFTLANAYPMHSLPVWSGLKAAGKAELRQALADPAFRDGFRDQLRNPRKGTLFYGSWQRIQVATAARPENRGLEGRTLAEIAGSRDPVDVFFDLGLAEDLDTVFSAQLVNADEEKLAPLLRHDCGVIALSDAGAHLSFLCDAGYGLHLLGHWVRDRKVFTVEEAVRKLTSIPATIYGIKGRGRLAEGYAADLLLFDPATVAPSKPLRRADLPGGHTRVTRSPIGVAGVWVNGTRLFENGEELPVTRAPGKVLRDFAQ